MPSVSLSRLMRRVRYAAEDVAHWWSFRTRAQRIRLACVGGVFFLLLLGAVWIVVTGLMARADLDDARAGLSRLRHALVNGDTAEARRLIGEIRDNAQSAHQLTTGPAWFVGANVPVLGTPLETSRTIAAQVDRISTDVLPAALTLAEQAPHLRGAKPGSVDLSRLRGLEGVLSDATRVARDVRADVADS